MKTFNVIFTQMKMYEAVIEAETVEKAVEKVRNCHVQEEDLIENANCLGSPKISCSGYK